MENLKRFGKSCAPFGLKKEEEEENDAPIATRLRSAQVGHLASPSKNQIDQHGTNSGHKSNGSEVHSSSCRRTKQHGQLAEGPKNKSHETKTNRRFAQPNQNKEANNTNASSSKMENVRISKESRQQNRPLEEEDPYDLPVVELDTQYIRSQESQRQRVGYMCELCERDVGLTPFGEVEEEDSDLYPETSIFPCGHVYHTSCLRFQFGNEDITEDSCIFCMKF